MEKQRKLGLNRRSARNSLLFILIFLYGCSPNSDQVVKYNAQLFEISYPKSVVMKFNSESKFSGVVTFNDVDTAYYSFGYHVSTLAEKLPELVFLRDVKDEEIRRISKENNVDNKQFTNVPNADIDKLRKQNILFSYKDSQVWKYSIPIDTTKGGVVGLYIDSVLVDDYGILRFNFYFNNLRRLSYSESIGIVNSIKLNNDSIKELDFYPTKIVE